MQAKESAREYDRERQKETETEAERGGRGGGECTDASQQECLLHIYERIHALLCVCTILRVLSLFMSKRRVCVHIDV